MARDPKQLRKAYEYKLGKDLADKLSDVQIASLSTYYNRASEEEQSKIDSELIKGMGDFLDSARALADEGVISEPKLPVQKYKKEDLSEVKAKEDAFNKDEPEDEPEDLEDLDDILKEIREEQEEVSEKLDEVLDETEDEEEDDEGEDIPEGLDDILNEIKEPEEDKKDTSALAVIDKKDDESEQDDEPEQQDEEIDPKILKILGLDDVFDLDYDDYRTLLKEKMAADRMGQKVDGGDAELISDEYKRVRHKKGSFSQKKKEVQIAKVVKNERKDKKSTVDANKLLKSSKDVKSNKEDAVTDSFDNINETLVGIDSLLKDILGEEKKESKQEDTTTRKAAQKREEEKSEKGAKKKATIALKGFKPPKMGFFDMIKRFFGNILAGGIVLKMLDWIRNKENQKKIENVITFITDNLDKILLGIAAIVGIGIGAKILSFLTLFTPLVSGLVVVLKGLLGLLIGPAGLIAALVAGIFAATAASKGPIEDLIRDNFKRTYGEEYADEGAFITKLGDQYGRIASEKDRERLLSDDEKQSAFYIDQYDHSLKERKKLSDAIKRDEKTVATTSDRRTRDAATKKLEENKTKLKQVEIKIKTLKEQISIGGKSLEQLQKEFTDGLILPQTGLSKELYPTAGTGAEMSGVPKHFGKGKTSSARDSLSEEDRKVTPGTLPPSAAQTSTSEVTPQTSLLGKQSSAPTADYGVGSDGGPKGYIIVPGHAAGLGAPGEMEITPQLADNLVANLRKRVGPDVPVKVINMHAETELTQPAFIKQQDRLKALEDQGYEVIELHMDASVESGASPGGGRGVILPMPGTDAINPVEADFAKTSGAFPREHRDGLAGTNRGASLIELGNMSPALQKSALSGEVPKSDLDLLTKPLEDSLIRGLNLMEVKPKPKVDPPPPPNTDQASVIPLSGRSGQDIASASTGGRQAAASFSSTDKNNNSPVLTGTVYNLGAVV